MTLILTAVHRYGVVQVVDRLVTITRGTRATVEQFDPRANKTVLFRARDGFITLAYTGPAYIDGRPTDQWIAETLRDKPVSAGRDGQRPALVAFERLAKWPSIGQVVARLSDRLMAPTRFMSASWPPMTIVMAGWQLYGTKRPRAFGLTITSDRNRTRPVERIRRHLGRGIGLMTVPDGHLSSEEQIAVLHAIGRGTPDEAERAMVAEIRKVAARTDVVGPHCMCVALLAPSVGRARIRCESAIPDTAHLISKRGILQLPVTYSPWILTDSLAMAPAIQGGGGDLEIQVGGWLLQIEGGERHHPVSVSSAQARPRQPR